MRYGQSGQLVTMQFRTSPGDPQQQSKHFARIALNTGIVTWPADVGLADRIDHRAALTDGSPAR
jgi:hypothetical protein